MNRGAMMTQLVFSFGDDGVGRLADGPRPGRSPCRRNAEGRPTAASYFEVHQPRRHTAPGMGRKG
jgi:hypothetical protein